MEKIMKETTMKEYNDIIENESLDFLGYIDPDYDPDDYGENG